MLQSVQVDGFLNFSYLVDLSGGMKPFLVLENEFENPQALDIFHPWSQILFVDGEVHLASSSISDISVIMTEN